MCILLIYSVSLILVNFSENGSYTIFSFWVMSPHIDHQVKTSHIHLKIFLFYLWLEIHFVFFTFSTCLKFWHFLLCLGMPAGVWGVGVASVLREDTITTFPISNHCLVFFLSLSKYTWLLASKVCFWCSLAICIENIVTHGDTLTLSFFSQLHRILSSFENPKENKYFLKKFKIFHFSLVVPAC